MRGQVSSSLISLGPTYDCIIVENMSTRQESLHLDSDIHAGTEFYSALPYNLQELRAVKTESVGNEHVVDCAESAESLDQKIG